MSDETKGWIALIIGVVTIVAILALATTIGYMTKHETYRTCIENGGQVVGKTYQGYSGIRTECIR